MICGTSVQDASLPLTPPVFGPFHGVEGKMWREGGGQGEDRSRGVLYCSTALWWQAGGHFSLLAIRCNADGSQGYACVAASTGLQSEGQLSFRKLVALLLCNGFIYSH